MDDQQGARALNKQTRKRAILEAARALILEDAGKDFSMPALASRAGVSLVTPYNLFGSKSNILLEIVREDIFDRARDIDNLNSESLREWITRLAEILAGVFYRKRHFFRRMIVTLVAQESAEAQREMLNLTYGTYESPIARLQQRGLLSRIVPAPIVARHLAHGVSGALQHRLMQRGTEAELRDEIESAVLMTLSGLSSDLERPLLLQRLAALEPEARCDA